MSVRIALRVAVIFAFLLGALGTVTWRQSRTRESLAVLDELRRQISVASANRVELERGIQVLESRAHVVPAAREQLGMHIPVGVEFLEADAGFDWTASVKPLLPDHPDWCPSTHFGYLESGEMRVHMQDGTEQTVKAGETYFIPPGHLPVFVR